MASSTGENYLKHLLLLSEDATELVPMGALARVKGIQLTCLNVYFKLANYPSFKLTQHSIFACGRPTIPLLHDRHCWCAPVPFHFRPDMLARGLV